jgi:hypothetical protein
MSQLASQVADYCYILVAASRKGVNTWTNEDLQKNIQWSVFVECEIATLEDGDIEVVLEQAAVYNRRVSDITAEMLMDAHHTLYKALIGNPYLRNDMFWRIVQTYRFLNRPDETCEEALIQVRESEHNIEWK